MSEDEFAAWLVDRGLAENKRGYGHATGESIASELYGAGFTVVPNMGDEK